MTLPCRAIVALIGLMALPTPARGAPEAGTEPAKPNKSPTDNTTAPPPKAGTAGRSTAPTPVAKQTTATDDPKLTTCARAAKRRKQSGAVAFIPTEWTIRVTGAKADSPKKLRAFFSRRLDEKVRTRNPLNAEAEEELCAYAETLGYHLLRIDKRTTPAGTVAILRLHKIVTVHSLNININNYEVRQLFDSPRKFIRRFFDSTFNRDIVRRMRLRQGAPLEREKQFRKAQYLAEEDRIRASLSRDGYYEARVKVTPKLLAKNNAVVLQVNVNKGPRYRVGDIKVSGATAFSEEEIADRFRHAFVCPVFCIGEAGFSRTTVRKDVEKLEADYKKRGYPGIVVRTTDFRYDPPKRRVHFTVNIVERRKVDVVFLSDNKRAIDDKALKEVLTFYDEGSYDNVEIKASAQAIQALYQRAGYFETQVGWERERFGATFERIIYTIHEGPKLAVDRVRFLGNRTVDDKTLRAIVNTGNRGSIGLLDVNVELRVTWDRVASDVRAIREHYRRRGYPDAEIEPEVKRQHRVPTNAATLAAAVASELPARKLDVTYRIRENRKHTQGQVRFRFYRDTSSRTDVCQYNKAWRDYCKRRTAQVREVVGLKRGRPWTREAVKKAQNALRRYYFEQGYPRVEIETDDQLGKGQTEHDAEFTIVEHRAARVGKIMIRGNHATRDWVILDELGYEENALYSLRRAEEGKQNLRVLGLFGTADVDPIDMRDYPEEETVNVLVKVQERPSISLEAAVGYSTDASAFISGRFIDQNLFGVGLRGDIRGRFGQQFQSAELNMASPRHLSRRIYGLGLRTALLLSYRSEQTERFGDLRSAGGSLAFEKSGRYGFFRGWTFALRYDVRRRNRDVDLVRAPGPSNDLSTGPVTTWTGQVGPTLTIDKRTDRGGNPNPLSPERGFKLEMRASYADPVLSFNQGSERFLKLGLGFQYLKLFGKRILLTNSVRYDHGVPFGASLLPDVERFFAGGDTTVRGFSEDRLATEVIEDAIPPLGEVTQLRVLPASGNIRGIHNLDLQVQLWEIKGIPISSAIFFDTGFVTNSLSDLDLRRLRHAIGAALMRINLPLGTLSIEYAIPIDPQLGDDPRGHLHINLGFFF